MTCRKCGQEIGEDRVEAYLEIFGEEPTHCVGCSPVEAPYVYMAYDHKTGGRLEVIQNRSDGTRDPGMVEIAKRMVSRSR